MKLYFFIKVQHTGDTDLGQADIPVDILSLLLVITLHVTVLI